MTWEILDQELHLDPKLLATFFGVNGELKTAQISDEQPTAHDESMTKTFHAPGRIMTLFKPH